MPKPGKLKAKRRPTRAAKPNRLLVEQGLSRRVLERVSLSVSVKLPSVPALVEHYVELSARLFAAVGRSFDEEDKQQARRVLAAELERAFAFSQRSKIEIRFVAPPGAPMAYEVQAERRSLVDTYDRWLGSDERELFGKHADARILAAASTLGAPEASPVLDFGAGTGRNALELARLGHPVDAVEITSRFAQMIATEASRTGLGVRTIQADVFRDRSQLRRDYRLLFASEVASDFRDVRELKQFFELGAHVLGEGGLLVFNAHVARRGYTPDRATREFAQHCYSALYTATEVAQALEGLPFEFVSNDAAADYERQNLAPEAWPPTPWFENWATGRDVFELEHERPPLELCWLVLEKRGECKVLRQQMAQAILSGISPGATGSEAAAASQCLVPNSLRKGLLQRLAKRTLAAGQLVLPAVPALHKTLGRSARDTYQALGRAFDFNDFEEFDGHLTSMLEQAFATSPRSNVVLDFELAMGSDVRFELNLEAPSIAEVYADWHANLPSPLFGERHDARLEALVHEGVLEPKCPVLDLGAGLGRNALWLAGQGHATDAVEFTPAFANFVRAEAEARGVPLRVIERSLFELTTELHESYGLVLCVGTAADLRSTEALRQLFQLAAARLAPGGLCVMSVHVLHHEFGSDPALRQWAEQCCCMCFTEGELREAREGLDLECISNHSAHDFELKHLPAHAWPPTPVFEEWSLGRHMLDVSRAQMPLELRWLVFKKGIPC